MNKKQLIAAVTAKTGMSQAAAGEAVSAFQEVITEQLKSGGEVNLIGFGSFLVRRREEREGRNPATGETITIAAANVPSFKAGKGLRDAVNGE